MDLPYDAMGTIVGFLDMASIHSVRLVSKEWAMVAKKYCIYDLYCTWRNSTTLSFVSMRTNGSKAPMSFVTVVDFSFYDFLQDSMSVTVAYEALVAVDIIGSARRRPIDLYMCKSFLELADPEVLDLLSQVEWNEVCIANGDRLPKGFRISSKLIRMPGHTYYNTAVPEVSAHTIELHGLGLDMQSGDLDFSSANKYFKPRRYQDLQFQCLKLFGSLSSVPIGLSKLHTLELDSCIDLHKKVNLRYLQDACPTLVKFGLRNSNITFHDLYHYDWSRWTMLQYLDLEENYTLILLPECIPRHLKGLYIESTGIKDYTVLRQFKDLYFFSCSLDSQTDIFTCLPNALVELKVRFTHFWKAYTKDYLREHFKHVSVIHASFFDYFNVKRCFLDLQEMCTGTVLCKVH